MKIIVLTLLISSILVSCNNFGTKNVVSEPTDITVMGRTIETYIIDSCEYIGYIHGSNGDWGTHKGNCKFCKKRSDEANRNVSEVKISKSQD